MYADSDFDADFSPSGDLAHLTPAECVRRLDDPRLAEAERAGLLCRLGGWQLQEGLLEGDLAKLAEGITLFDQALLLRSDLAAAYHGRALDGLGRFREALANYDQAVRLAAKPRAELWRDRGCALRSLGRYGEALTNFNKALERQPQDALSMSAKGSLLAVLRRQKQAAMQLCDRALQIAPNLSEAWNSKGVVHSVAGQYAEAQQCYERAIALGLLSSLPRDAVIVTGLMIFGIIFAFNSAVHSYLVLAFTDDDKVALNVGFYYMANSAGRLAGTVLSGLIYQLLGLVGCLWMSSLFVLAAWLIELRLPDPKPMPAVTWKGGEGD